MDNPLRGILLIAAATVCFSCSDALTKYLGQFLPVLEIAWIRYFTFVLLAFLLLRMAGHRRIRVRSPLLQVLRGLGIVGSAVSYIIGLRYLPIADAAAINFISPLLITVLAVPMLHEVVGIRRWIAVGVGLIGVLIVVRPGAGAFQIGSVSVLICSLCWALASILTRRLAATDPAAVTIVWTSLTGFVVLTVLLPLNFAAPSPRLFVLCVMMGIVASVGQFLMVQAYRHAAASVLAPFSYVQLIWSATLGWLVFDALPDGGTVTGASIIVASGLYSANRERLAMRARRTTARKSV